MGSSDTDYVFSDEYSPEGWPELDWQEFMLGEWIKGKTPSSLALRRHLAEVVRFFRTQLAKRESRFPSVRLAVYPGDAPRITCLK